MYDREVTAKAVKAAGERLGFELVYHSQAQIDAAVSLLNDLMDDERGLKRNLAPDEIRFIQNERALCALDFRNYWLVRYARIINWRKQPVVFQPNVAQNIMLDVWAESERKGEAIWTQNLKARRLGISTIAELKIQHAFQFIPYTNAVIASADPDKTVEMAGVVKYCLNSQPWWLKPRATKILKGIPIEHGEIHANLTIQAGNQFNGVARGSSPNLCHLSELSEWVDAADLVDGALLPAIQDHPGVFGMLESTASGDGWWKTKWEQTKRDWARGRGRMRPVFLPWYTGIDIYPTEAMLRKNPIPANWVPSDRTILHAERARQYVLSNPLLFDHLAKGDKRWEMPRRQMWWREVNYETAKDMKELHIFLAEACADDFEAFQSSNIPVIDPEILIGYQERARAPIAVYTVVGPDIPQALVTPRRYWDTSKPTITVRTQELTPRYDVKYQLVPLRFEGYDSFEEDLKLLIWEWPQDGDSYGVGTDCSEGIGQDNAVIEVLREATPDRAPGQVAEWASNRVTAFQMWPIVLAVSCLYSTFSVRAQRRAQCRLAIESQTNGSALQNELKKRGWSNFHSWKYNDTKKPKTDAQAYREGIFTNHWLRSILMDMLLTSLSEEAIDIPSPYLVQELTTLERVMGQKKAAAASGSHDDRVMAVGFPLFSLHQGKRPSQQYARKRVEYAPGLAEEGKVYPIFSEPSQAYSTPHPLVQKLSRNVRGKYQLDRAINFRMPKGFQ